VTDIYIAGHSLGGADAYGYAHSRARRGLPVAGVYAFEPPNFGNRVVGDVLRATVPLVIGTKNHRDLVCDVPPENELLLPPEEYVQPVPFLPLDKPGSGIDFLFRDHHIDLIQAGVHALPDASKPPHFDRIVDLVARLYAADQGWDWINPVDGLYWAMARIDASAVVMIRRGSKTGMDWLVEDFNFRQRDWYGARASIGFCDGIEPVQDKLDAALS
jgi:hypothetical protein